MKLKRRKLNWKNLILLILIMTSFIFLVLCLINILKWQLENNHIQKQIEYVQNISDIIEPDDSENTEIINNDIVDKTDPYWDYINVNLINVNFTELKKVNPNTKGWIQVKGTNINYPFVQTNNNDYYLKHSFDNTKNSAGWVFLDYRNDTNSLSKNTIIYAHGRQDATMFGSLKNVLNNNWLENIDNHIVKISTETENSLWQVFSVYHIPTTNDYIQVKFGSNEEFVNWAMMLMDRSEYNFNTTINDKDNILTLSTCYNNTEKVVLHAKLIKKEKR